MKEELVSIMFGWHLIWKAMCSRDFCPDGEPTPSLLERLQEPLIDSFMLVVRRPYDEASKATFLPKSRDWDFSSCFSRM